MQEIFLVSLYFALKTSIELLSLISRGSTVKPLCSGHLWFLKKVSARRRCPLYRFLNFFEEKIIIDKNLTIFYANCDQEKDGEYYKHAVATMYDSFPQNEVVVDVPFYWSELANKFLKFPNHHISVVGTGNRVNRGIGLGIEIPVDYIFHGDNQVIGWFKNP